MVVKGETVTARLGTTTSPATLMLLGSATIRATHTVDVSKTEAKADAEGKTAIGASVAINVVLEWCTLAELARSASATSVSVTAESTDQQRHQGGCQRVGCQRHGQRRRLQGQQPGQ